MRNRRIYLLGRRIHHGLIGVLATLIGLGLIAHDHRDYPWPTRDR